MTLADVECACGEHNQGLNTGHTYHALLKEGHKAVSVDGHKFSIGEDTSMHIEGVF